MVITVQFKVNPPHEFDLAFHKDWVDEYGTDLFKKTTFMYKNVDFELIAKASRN